METEGRAGAPIRFVFPEEAPLDSGASGEVLEFDPPKVFAFSWNLDVLRFELLPDGDGCLLMFTQTIGGGGIGRLDGTEPPPPPDWLPEMERSIERFGLAEGSAHETAEGYELRFARDLAWKRAAEIWQLPTDGTGDAVEPGGPAPRRATHGHLAPGRVTTVSAPHVLEYEWLHDGTPAGRVRFEMVADPEQGTRVELTQTLPAALAHLRAELPAAWHVHLELFFAATFGDAHRP